MGQPIFSNAGFEQLLEITKGSDFSIMLEVLFDSDEGDPYDLTGHEVKAALVSAGDTPGTPVEFTFDPGQVTLTEGRITGTLSAAQTGTLIANNRKMAIPGYRWNCEIKTPEGQIIPFCFGSVIVRSSAVTWS